MNNHKRPEVIRFNAIDRYYMIPETDDEHSPYFPMSVMFGVELCEALSAEHLIDALMAVNAKYPQFRLGYTLDYAHERWLKVPDDQLKAHFAALVHIGEATAGVSRDDLVSAGLSDNPQPLSHPEQFTLYGRTLLIKHQHCFGDGRFMMTVIPAIILAAFDRAAFDALPMLSMNFGLPVWKVVWQSPRQGLQTLWTWLRTLRSTISDFSTSPQTGDSQGNQLPRMAIRSGTPERSTRYVIESNVLHLLDEMRQEISTSEIKVSLNTIIQVLFMHRAIELGLQEQPPAYTMPTDLKRYLDHPGDFQAGNLAGQIRVKTTPHTELDWRADCLEMQAKVDTQLRQGLPMATFPMEWLMGLGGRKLVRKLNRDWLLNSPNSDRRFIIITNLGKVDAEWNAALPFIDRSGESMSLAGPLMGGPPLLIVIFGLEDKCYLTLTYNPALLTHQQIKDVLVAASPEWLTQKRQVLNREPA